MNLKKILEIIASSFQEGDGKGSAKRFTLFALVGMLGYVIVRYTDVHNSVSMATILVGGILALAGVNAYQKVNDKDK